MAKHRRKVGRHRSGPPAKADALVATALTVGWMLSTLVTLLAELGALVAWGIVVAGDPQSLPQSLTALPGFLLFAGMITGTLSLLLVPLVYAAGRQRPPWQITLAAVIISLLPAATGGLFRLLN